MPTGEHPLGRIVLDTRAYPTMLDPTLQVLERIEARLTAIEQRLGKEKAPSRVWAPIAEYVRSRFPLEETEARVAWIRRRLLFVWGSQPGWIADKVRAELRDNKRVWIHTRDADQLLGFGE